MNLQPIIRAAVCAALVVVCLAGAGWFPTQPVSGQEPARDQQTYRPRNFPFRSTVRIAALIFAQTKPGREPESRAKTKRLYLRWNVQQVGMFAGFPRH